MQGSTSVGDVGDHLQLDASPRGEVMHLQMLLFQILKAAGAFKHTLTPSYRDHICCFCTFLCDFCFYDYMLLPFLINTFFSLAPCSLPKQCFRNR